MTWQFIAITVSAVPFAAIRHPLYFLSSSPWALYLRKLAPGSDINCCIAFTGIQTELPTPVTIIFPQHQDVVYCVNAVPAGLSTHPSPPFASIYRGKIAAIFPRIVADHSTQRERPRRVNKMSDVQSVAQVGFIEWRIAAPPVVEVKSHFWRCMCRNRLWQKHRSDDVECDICDIWKKEL